MIYLGWLWKGIFFCFCIFHHLQFEVVDGHHYACVALDGHDGLCVARRLCREAPNFVLNACEWNDTICCPANPTYRGVTSTTSAPVRPYRPIQDPPYDRNPPRRPYYDDDERARYPVRQSGRPYRPRQDPPYDRNPPRRPYDDDDERSRYPVRQSGRPYRPRQDPPYDRNPPRRQYDYDEEGSRRPIRQYGRPAVEPTEPQRDSLPDRRRSEPTNSDYDQKQPEVIRDDSPHHHDTPHEHPHEHSHEHPHEHPEPRPEVPACGVKPYDLFIAGGEVSKKHEWPWMAAIFRRHVGSKPKTFQCGGSLINTRYILTAAHCFVINHVTLPASAYVVRLGSLALSSGEEFAVSNIVLHHNHSGSEFFNDIALVRLSSEVYITDKIVPICLPFGEMLQENFVGRMAVVAGWGDTLFRSEGTRVLKHVSLPVVSNEECAAAYRRVRGAVFLARGSNHVMCAGLMEGGKDACQGDSGGPLMLKSDDDRWSVIGIVSLGYKCAEPGYPGVYTRVTHYMSWIQENIKPY